MTAIDDYYELLGVKKDATHAEIKEQYRWLIKENHPDKYRGLKAKYEAEGDAVLLQLIEEKIANAEAFCASLNIAYQTLSDPVLRRYYDENHEEVQASEIVINPTKVVFGKLEQSRKSSKSFVIENRGGPVHAIDISWEDKPDWGELEFTPDPHEIFPIKVTILADTHGLSPGDKTATITIDVDGHIHAVHCSLQVKARPADPRPSSPHPPVAKPPSPATRRPARNSRLWLLIVGVIAILGFQRLQSHLNAEWRKANFCSNTVVDVQHAEGIINIEDNGIWAGGAMIASLLINGEEYETPRFIGTHVLKKRPINEVVLVTVLDPTMYADTSTAAMVSGGVYWGQTCNRHIFSSNEEVGSITAAGVVVGDRWLSVYSNLGQILLTSVRSGSRLLVLGRTAEGDWLYVQLPVPDERRGWVRAERVEIEGHPLSAIRVMPTMRPAGVPEVSPSPINMSTPTTDEEVGSTTVTGVVTGDFWLSVYRSPGQRPLTSVRSGSRLLVLGRTAEGDWLYVQLAHRGRGWVRADRVELEGQQLSDIRLMPDSSTITPILTPSPITFTNTPLPTCGNVPSRFSPGDTVVVDLNQGGALRILMDPSGGAGQTFAQAYDNERLILHEGPTCHLRQWYWRATLLKSSVLYTGWVAETDRSGRPYLCPISDRDCR